VGLKRSVGIVSTQGDNYLVYDSDICANDFTITIPLITVPKRDEYLNIRWKATDIPGRDTFVKAKMKPDRDVIVLDYNGHGNVATKNLYDVQVYGAGKNEVFPDWDKAMKRADLLRRWGGEYRP